MGTRGKEGRKGWAEVSERERKEGEGGFETEGRGCLPFQAAEVELGRTLL